MDIERNRFIALTFTLLKALEPLVVLSSTRRCTILAACICVCSGSILGQSERALKDQIDGLFAEWDQPDSPGCAVAVSRHGETLHLRGYGVADLEQNVPIGPRTVFDVASISKQFTAASIALLVQDGAFSLDDPIRKHLPEIPDYADPVTVRHLVHHQSGVPEVVDMFDLAGRRGPDVVTVDDVKSLLVRRKALYFEPGQRFQYSNINYILLGWIVEKVSGRSLREFAQARIFEPLGMKNSHFSDHHAEIRRSAAEGYRKDPTSGELRRSLDNQDLNGHSNLWTTAEDLLLWLNNFAHPRLGGTTFVAQMLEKPPPIVEGEGMHYGFGLYVDRYRGLRRIWHVGVWRHRSIAVFYPDQELAIACLCNNGEVDPRPLSLKIADWLLADHMEPASVDPVKRPDGLRPSEDELRRYAGTYWSREYRTAVAVRVEGDGLIATSYSGRERELRSAGRRRFFEPGYPPLPTSFLFQPRDGASTFDLVVTHGGVDIYLEPIEPHLVGREELEAYAGAYYSEDLDAVFGISAADGELLLIRRWRSQPIRLEPIFEDVFQGRVGSLTFERDVAGSVSGFVLQDLDVRFTRIHLDP